MKNIFKIALVSIILMTSCAKDSEFDTTSIPTIDTLYASIETPSTRTYADEDGKLLWHSNDKITVFLGNAYPRQWQFMGDTGKNYGAFNEINPPTGIITANPLDTNYAIYPYDGNTEITNDAKIKYTIPATQNYAEDSFGLEANVMVAVTKNKEDNFLAFKNLCGYFEFSLYGDINIRSIEFKGNNGEKLAGNAIITATNQNDPTFVFENGATETITLNCNDVELGKNEANATKFWFVVPAITYEKGITITITDSEGGTMEKLTNNPITIKRSTVQPLNAFLVETLDANTPPNNQIWYTSINEKVVTPMVDSFGKFKIRSNKYENGKGVMTFWGDVTTIGIDAFSMTNREKAVENNIINLVSITLPNSVVTIEENAFYKCENLESISIPSKVTDIKRCAFNECYALTSINLPSMLTTIEDWAFSKCLNLTEVIIPDNVANIGISAFQGCSSLESITIGNGVTSIGDSAFKGCNNVVFYGKYVYGRCIIINGELVAFAPTGISIYNIPNNTTSIGYDVFSNISGLTEINIPANVNSIGVKAFYNCRDLEAVYCASVSPPYIGTEYTTTFDNCDNNLKIYVPTTSVDTYKSANGWEKYTDKIEGYNFSNE